MQPFVCLICEMIFCARSLMVGFLVWALFFCSSFINETSTSLVSFGWFCILQMIWGPLGWLFSHLPTCGRNEVWPKKSWRSTLWCKDSRSDCKWRFNGGNKELKDNLRVRHWFLRSCLSTAWWMIWKVSIYPFLKWVYGSTGFRVANSKLVLPLKMTCLLLLRSAMRESAAPAPILMKVFKVFSCNCLCGSFCSLIFKFAIKPNSCGY